MSEVKYLDKTGLGTVWGKVKALVNPKADKSEMSVTPGTGADADKTTIQLKQGTSATVLTQHQDISGKADKDTDAVEGHLAKFDANGNPVDGDIAINNVAQKDGSYDQMQVGVAKDLASSQSVPAEIVFRNTGGSTSVGKGGAAFIDRIKGKTLVWNQLVGASTESVTISSGRKYYSVINGTKAIATSDGTAISVTGGTDMVTDLTLMFGAGNEPSTVAEFEALYPGYHDYDEGTLISNDAEAIETEGRNLYNPATGKANVIGGEQYYIGGTYTSISQGGETITPASGIFTPVSNGEVVVVGGNAEDTIINLSDPSRNGQYEPYWKSQVQLNLDDFYVKDPSGGADIHITGGLKSAGDVYDEIVGNKYIKRVGEVDMGTLTYSIHTYEGESVFVCQNITNSTSFICPRYLFVEQDNVNNNNSAATKMNELTLTYRHGGTNDRFYIKDSSYSDAATFKTAMSGVPLYYELATPIEYELVEALPTEYRVDSHGTERRLPADTASSVHAPFCAEITYSTNIKDTVENLPKNYINVDSMHAFLAALGAAMNGEWDMRQGNGRFIFTFTPNTPTNENE